MATALTTRPSRSYDLFDLGFADQFFQQMNEIQDEIARSAYGLFLNRQSGDGSAFIGDGSALKDWIQAESKLLSPVSVSIKEDADRLTVSADVPGFSIDEIKVHVDGQTLKICGKSEKSEKTESKVTNGSSESNTSRQFCCVSDLPAAVKTDGTSATLDKGILTLVLPKAEPAKQIEVKAA